RQAGSLRFDSMFELKKLSIEAIPAALEKASRYRLLNEPGAAESIYLDVLAVDPENQEALKNIVLAMSDRFGKDYAIGDARIAEYVTRIKDDYSRSYYTGIMYERRGKATLAKNGVAAFELFRQAMDCFETAEAMRPVGNEDAILRWNGCARIISRNNLTPRDMPHDFLE
ncbi:MAG: hypothetical protein WAU71_14155, partial [Pyrinomonadaceae bacterium]